jgi:hypothetical protein
MYMCIINFKIKQLKMFEISGSHGGEYEVQSRLRCTAVFPNLQIKMSISVFIKTLNIFVSMKHVLKSAAASHELLPASSPNTVFMVPHSSLFLALNPVAK